MKPKVKEFVLNDGLGAQIWRKLYAMSFAKHHNIDFEDTPITDFLIHESDKISTKEEKDKMISDFLSIINNPWSEIDFKNEEKYYLSKDIGAGLPEDQGGIKDTGFIKEAISFNNLIGSDNSIVIHLRRGNVIAENPRWINEEVYVNILKNIGLVIKEFDMINPEVIILTDAPDEDLEYTPISDDQKGLWNQPYLHANESGSYPISSFNFNALIKEYPTLKIVNKLSTFDSFVLMLRAKVLIVSKSAFSQSAGMLSHNNVIDIYGHTNGFANSKGCVSETGKITFYKKPEADKGCIFYKLHRGGMFNQFFSLEIAIGLAVATGKRVTVYNVTNDLKWPIDIPSISSGVPMGKRSAIISEHVPSILDLIDYPDHLLPEMINSNIQEPQKDFIVFDQKPLHEMYFKVSDGENEKKFAVRRERLEMIKDESYDLRSFNLAAYARFFFGRTQELDNALDSIKFKKEYTDFAKLVAEFIGDFNGIHLRLTDHQVNFAVSEEDFDHSISSLSEKKIILLTDEVESEMVKGKNVILLDDIIVDNFSKEYMKLPNTSEIAYGLVSSLVMTYANDFIGTPGSTFSNYIYRERLKRQDIRYKYLGVPDTDHGSPFSWNAPILEGQGSIYREWPESKLNL